MLIHHPQFFTATILQWKHLLKPDKYKIIILNSLKYLVNNERIILYAFVIMPNHIHLIWQIKGLNQKGDVQRDLLKYTAQQIKFDLQKLHPQVLEKFRVNVNDRAYQIWEHRPLSIELFSEAVLLQKLNYIHNNPVAYKWQICVKPEDYIFSSARFYLCNENTWEFLTHYCE